MNYSKALKELREKMLVSQKELADELGVAFATVNRWENGHFEPGYKAKRQLRNLFKKYHITLEEGPNDKL